MNQFHYQHNASYNTPRAEHLLDRRLLGATCQFWDSAVVCVAEVKYFKYLRARGTHREQASVEFHKVCRASSLVRAAEGLYQTGMLAGLSSSHGAAAQHEQNHTSAP